MNKTLVIVESPGKIKKIQSILGNNYIVKASVGHIQDLDSSNMSIDIVKQNDGSFIFIPKYKILDNKKSVVNNLISAYKNSNDVIIATDDDREGEFIAFSLKEVLKVSTPKRISFNEITSAAINLAIQSPKTINDNLVNSQKTRRILDRLIGYKIHPLLGSGLSAGRVQSVVVKMLIDKETDIKQQLNNLESKYNIVGNFDKLKGTLYGSSIPVVEELKYIISINPYFVDAIAVSNINKHPPPPFITSSLQQESSIRLKFSVQTTMSLAQKLYEKGYITYMRTDSTSLSKDFSRKVESFVKKTYGDKYYTYHTYKNKSSSQEAHECIRPTALVEISESDNENKLYDLIFKRTVASQMSPAQYQCQEIIIKNKDKTFGKRYFKTINKNLLFDGYTKVYNDSEEESKDNFVDLKKKSKIEINSAKGSEEFTYNNYRYNEASLVKQLETLEIGRPSTYAYIIKTIQERGYVQCGNVDGIIKTVKDYSIKVGNFDVTEKVRDCKIGFEKKKFIPTVIGEKVNTYLVSNFPTIMDICFTSDMEKKLDKIAIGKLQLQSLLNSFYSEFNPIVEQLMKENVKLVSKPDSKNLGKDDEGHTYSIMKGKYGWVIKKDLKDTKHVQFFGIDDPEITLNEAIKISSDNQYLGDYKSKPIFWVKGKFGYYLKYGNKNISIKERTTLNLDQAKNILKNI